MTEKKILHSIILIALLAAAALPWRDVALCQDSLPSIDGIMKLIHKGRMENKFTGVVRMEVNEADTQRVFSKQVWADYPERYHEKFVKAPDDPRLFAWMKRKRFFFFMRQETPGHGMPPFPPPPPPHEKMRRWNEMRMPGKDAHLRLLRNFETSVAPGPALAGRETYEVTFTPKIMPRPQIKFWTDREFGTILQLEFLKKEGDEWNVQYREYFVELTYNPEFHESDFPAPGPPEMPPNMTPGMEMGGVKELTSTDEIPENLHGPFLIPGNIPEGFSLERIRIVRRFVGGLLHLHYSDGVYAFSVFQGLGEMPPPMMHMMQQRKVIPGEVLEFHQRDRTGFFKFLPPVNIILIGNCDKSILRSVIDSLSQKDIRSVNLGK